MLVAEIKSSISQEAINKAVVLFKKPYFRLIVIGFAVGMFNQLAGINIIMYYSSSIFQEAGFSADSALAQTVLIGITNLVFTIIAMTVIDKFGRKVLLNTGAVGMTIFLGLFAWAFIADINTGYILLIFLIGYIAFFAFSQGAVIWVILSEMFPNNIRSRATAIGSFSHWFFNAIIAFLFPIASATIGNRLGICFLCNKHIYQPVLLL